MRTISQDILDALTNNPSYRIKAKIKVFASRHYFKDSDVIPTYVPTLVSTTTPQPEATTFAFGKLFTVLADGTALKGLLNNTATPIDFSITTDPLARPGIASWGTGASNKIYYWDGTDWKSAVFNTSFTLSATATFVAGATIPIGAIHPLGTNEAIIVYIDEGGARASLVDSFGDVHTSDGRFMDPNHILDVSVPVDAYRVHYSSAIKWVDSITGNTRYYVYYTAYNGSVQAMYYEWNGTENTHGIWSEIFIAIPEDLSTFAVGNTIIQDNRVFLIGKFTRRSDFASDSTYTLLAWSDDGKTFSLDRRTLVSIIDERWLVSYDTDNNNVYFSATGQFAEVAGAYQIAPDTCYSIEYKLKNLSGNATNGWNASTIAGAEYGFTDTWLDEGSYSELLVGVSTGDETDEGGEYEWISYQLCVLGGVTKAFADGQRNLEIQMVPDGVWHSSIMTYPFYMELQGKQYLHSPMKTLDTLYDQTGDSGQIWALTQDFNTSDLTDGFTAQEHEANTTSDHWCDDLETICSSYPIFGSEETYIFNLYGWSRAGHLSQNPNVADDTPTSTDNDDFYVMLTVEDLAGAQSDILATVEQLTSDHSNPAQTWFPAGERDGSYPVSYTIPNPGEGYKIIKLGARVISGATGGTTYFLERIEVPGIAALYIPTTPNTGYVIENRDIHYGQVWFNDTNFDLRALTDTPINLTKSWGLRGSGLRTLFLTPDDGVSHEYTLTMIHDVMDAQVGTITLFMASYAMWWTDENMLVTKTESYEYNVAKQIVITWTGTIPPNRVISMDASGTALWWGSDITQFSIISNTIATSSTNPPMQIKSVQKGIPQILFATTPYSTWNFDVSIRTRIKGTYTYSGCLGLGTDKNNFIIGYMKLGYLGIAKVRNGVRTTLYEQAQAGIISDTIFDLRFWHRDGLFGVEYKSSEGVWPNRGSMLTYEWKTVDEEIAPIVPIAAVDASGLAVSIIDISEIDSFVFHTGIYSIIDPPKFRTSGFNTASTYAPVMPLDLNPNTVDSDFLTLFPSSGKIDCNGYKFTYASKNTFFSDLPIQGPFQVRAIIDWNGTSYETDLEDSYHYTGDWAIEFFKFEWLPSAENHDKFLNAIIGTSNSQAWLNDKTFFKPWVTTDGVIVWQLERSRYYSANIPDMSDASLKTQAWITHGLAGLAAQGVTQQASFNKNSFVYLDSDDLVVIQGFTAESGEDDYSIAMLLDKFCRIAGTNSNFPGDIITATHTFSDGGSLTL